MTEMAYGIFEDNDLAHPGTFTTEEAAKDFLTSYFDGEDGAESLYVDKVCGKHETDQAESACECWYDGPYEDARDIHTGYGRMYPS